MFPEAGKVGLSTDTFAPMRVQLLLLAGTLLVRTAHGQDDPRVFVPYAQQAGPILPADSGQLVLHEPARVTQLMKDYAASKQPLKGYRVQVFLGEREKAEETRRAFLLRHPEVPAYLSYLAPNFRVRVGDQRTRLEGEKLRQELASEFPGLYVVPDDIELPRLPE